MARWHGGQHCRLTAEGPWLTSWVGRAQDVLLQFWVWCPVVHSGFPLWLRCRKLIVQYRSHVRSDVKCPLFFSLRFSHVPTPPSLTWQKSCLASSRSNLHRWMVSPLPRGGVVSVHVRPSSLNQTWSDDVWLSLSFRDFY